MKKYYLLFVGVIALLLASCEKSEPRIDNGNEDKIPANSLFILNEGNMGGNDASLSLFDMDEEKLYTDFFKLVNERGLGDTGNDMLKYGSKIYISLTHSSIIEVIDASTGKSLKQISMKDNGVSKQPNKLVAHGGKVYATSYDNTVTRIDTISLERDGSVDVGRDPEGICVSGNNLYVANSGGLDFESANHDNTVSVIDITTFKEVEKIDVGKNPYQVYPDSKGNVYVSTRAIYDSNFEFVAGATLKVLNTQTKEIETIEGVIPTELVIVDNIAYIVIEDWTRAVVATFDCESNKIIEENIIPSDFEMASPYHISIDKASGDIFLTETDYTTPGSVHCFDKNGKAKYTVKGTGLNPKVVIRN